MERDKPALPDDPQLLKQIISSLTLEKQTISDKYELLKEKFEVLQRKFFGKSSEKLSAEDIGQMVLFNEAETHGNPDLKDEETNSEITTQTTVKEHTRKKAGRKAIPDYIPRVEIMHDLSSEEKECPCCKTERPRIGAESPEELDYVPAKIQVLQHIYPKYGPCACDEFLQAEIPEVKSAPFVPRLVKGCMGSNGFLAYAIVSKFADALPFYRLSKMCERIGVEMSRATLCNWMIEVSEKMDPFFEVFIEELKSGNFMRMDETTVQVLHEENRAAASISYMWVAAGYPQKEKPLVLYNYHPARLADVPDDFLKEWEGYLQTDGYAGCNRAVRKNKIIHVGCLAHVRREFFDAMKNNKKESRAHKALLYIQKIYEIESRLRAIDLDDEIFVERRKKEVIPILDDFYAWLIGARDELLPSSLTRKAIMYTLNEWDKIIRYLDLACMTPDNNEIERRIKPFAVGRKNWLFSNTPRGANASARMYSLVESAKANRLEPFAYLNFLLARLPLAKDKKSIKALLPCYLEPKDLIP